MTQENPNPVSGMPPMETPEDLEPLYSNLARISHTPSEIIIDFSRMLPAQAEIQGAQPYFDVPDGCQVAFARTGRKYGAL